MAMTIYNQLSRLEEIMALAPKAELLREVEQVCRGETACKVFWCERVANVAWLPLMTDSGWFAPVPNSIRDGDMIIHPAWPESSILLRFAKSVPMDVARIIAATPDSDNPRVGDQLIRIAGEFDHAEPIAVVRERIRRVLAGRTRSARVWLLEMLVKWLSSGASSDVLQLLPALIALESGDSRGVGRETWELRRLDEKVFAPLALSHGAELVDELSSAIDTAEKTSEHTDSDLWLEDFLHNPGYTHQPEIVLALRIYNTCRELITGGGASVALQVNDLLSRRQRHLFRRMRWQLYADFPKYYLEQARQEVVARIPEMNRRPHEFELQNLISTFVAEYGNRFLSESNISNVVQTISAGPVGEDGKIESDEHYVARFRAKQIQPFRPLLPNKQLFEVKDPRGESLVFDSQDYKPFRSMGEVHTVEQRSPLTPADLANMPDDKLWPLLNEWVPDPSRSNEEWWIEEGVAGLAEAFAKATRLNQARFSPSSKWWESLKRPAFLWRILDQTLVDEKGSDPATDDWETWLGLCEYVVAQRPIEQPDAKGQTDDTSATNPTWKYARWSAARLIERMLRRKTRPPSAEATRIGRLLQQLITDDDPRLAEIDKSWSSSSFDWLSKAINSSAGTAVEALLLFALWQKETARTPESFEWISELLSQQLSKSIQSPAIFAVLGSQLVVLVHLFEEWCRESGELLFPFSTRPEHASAALVSHLGYTNPHTLVLKGFPQLPDQALQHIDYSEGRDKSESRQQIPFRLGYHLSYYYWNALPDAEVAGKRLDNFFKRALPQTRGRLITELGHIFAHAPQDALSEPIRGRVKALWDERFESIMRQVRVAPDSLEQFLSELEAFAEWLKIESLDAAWRLSRFGATLEVLPASPESYDLAKTLDRLSENPQNLRTVIRCVELLTRKMGDRFKWSLGETDLKEALKRGLGTDDPETRSLAVSARDNLLRNCLFEYQRV
jgi:hypothetical protein